MCGSLSWMTITVNAPPVATDDASSVPADAPTVIDVQANDSDPDGDPLTTWITSQPQHGTLALNADGTIT